MQLRDPEVRPGQFLLRETHSWQLSSVMSVDRNGSLHDPGLVRKVEHRSRTWIPADFEQEWVQLRITTGAYEWVRGDEQRGREFGLDPVVPETAVHRAPRGEFFGAHPGGWMTPNPEWLAALPADREELYRKLRADTAGRGRDPDLQVVVYATAALRSGIVPAPVRSTIYQALALVPGMVVTETSFRLSRAGTTTELELDPDTGLVVAEHDQSGDLPRTTTTTRTLVVDEIVY